MPERHGSQLKDPHHEFLSLSCPAYQGQEEYNGRPIPCLQQLHLQLRAWTEYDDDDEQQWATDATSSSTTTAASPTTGSKQKYDATHDATSTTTSTATSHIFDVCRICQLAQLQREWLVPSSSQDNTLTQEE